MHVAVVSKSMAYAHCILHSELTVLLAEVKPNLI